jgi:hypothetical protein
MSDTTLELPISENMREILEIKERMSQKLSKMTDVEMFEYLHNSVEEAKKIMESLPNKKA